MHLLFVDIDFEYTLYIAVMCSFLSAKNQNEYNGCCSGKIEDKENKEKIVNMLGFGCGFIRRCLCCC